MSDAVQDLGEAARKLSPAERIRLVDEILSSLDQTNPSLDATWAAEAEDRIAAYRRGEIRALDLSEILSKYNHK
jgi:putative addiction module component (TIGR02574 family)